jgi:hypothetical protein
VARTAYVLGHSSIRLTIDLYGRWLPMANKAAVDRLDEGSTRRNFAPSGTRSGSKAVAAAANAPDTPGLVRGRSGQPPKSFVDSEDDHEDPTEPKPLLD